MAKEPMSILPHNPWRTKVVWWKCNEKNILGLHSEIMRVLMFRLKNNCCFLHGDSWFVIRISGSSTWLHDYMTLCSCFLKHLTSWEKSATAESQRSAISLVSPWSRPGDNTAASVNSLRPGTVFIRQNLTSVDVRSWRIKTVPALKNLKYL